MFEIQHQITLSEANLYARGCHTSVTTHLN